MEEPSTPMELALARVRAPERVLVPERLRMAPTPPTPVLLSVIGSALVMELERARVAPVAIVVVPAMVPRPPLFWISRVPALRAVAPV